MTQSKTHTRLEFISHTSSLAGVAALSGFAGSSVKGHAANNKTLKLGLIGCGRRGSGAARQALIADDKVELVAMPGQHGII